MSKYRILDLSKDPRKAHYEYFRTLAYPYVGVSVEVDITEWLQQMKAKQNPFFLSFLYACVRAANAVPEFRRRIWEEQLVEYDSCEGSFTVALPDETYCYCSCDAEVPFEEYLQETRKRMQKAMENPDIEDGEDALSLLFISSLPWISFTSFIQPTPYPADSNPRITWGKYHVQEGRTLIPVSVQCNHALVDGRHLARFYEELNRELQDMMNQ